MYQQHCQNQRAIQRALKFTQLAVRRAISEDRGAEERTFTLLLSHLAACWIEVRVLKLAHEPNAFDEEDINRIIAERTLELKWTTALDLAVCRAYSIGGDNDSENISRRLGFTPRQRYKEMRRMITEDLAPSAELRNRIAHGQWEYAFTNDLRRVSPDLMRRLKAENIVRVQLRVRIFETLSSIIHDLAVSPSTFERDFDLRYRRLEEQKRHYEHQDYEVYREKMRAKRERGLAKREERLSTGGNR